MQQNAEKWCNSTEVGKNVTYFQAHNLPLFTFNNNNNNNNKNKNNKMKKKNWRIGEMEKYCTFLLFKGVSGKKTFALTLNQAK